LCVFIYVQYKRFMNNEYDVTIIGFDDIYLSNDSVLGTSNFGKI